MDYDKAELEILEALDSKEISKEEAKQLLSGLEEQNAPIVDEMHPDISFKTRLVYKNLGGDPESSFNYLQKQHPELKFKKDASGEVLAKKPGEKEWRRLDPTGFDLQDITDVGYDLFSGISEGGAAVAGGLAGGAAGLPTGPGAIATGLAGASAAGGATGAGLEALRQKMGNWAGIDQEVQMDDVKNAGLFGAATPLLFGTGAGAKQIAKQAAKQVTKGGVTNIAEKEAAEAALKQTQRGLFGQAKSKISAKTGQLMSGIDSGTLDYMSKNLDKIDAAEKSGTSGAEIYTELREQIQDKLQDRLDVSGKILSETNGAEGIKVSIKEVEAPIMELIQKYEGKALKSIDKYGDEALDKVDYKNYEYIRDRLTPYLSNKDEVLSGYEVKDYLDNINEVTQIAKNHNLATKPKVDKDIIRISRVAAGKLDKQASSGEAGKIYKNFKTEYSKLLTIKDKVDKKWFKDDEMTERTLNQLLSPKKKAKKLGITRAMEELDVPLTDTARESITNSLFVDPNMDVLSSMGTTSTSRSIPLSTLGGLAGYGIGAQAGEGHGGGAVGAGIGAFFGGKIGSAAAMKAFAKANKGLGNFGGGVQSLPLLPGAPNIQGTFNILDNLQRNDR